MKISLIILSFLNSLIITEELVVNKSQPLKGEISLLGAKNSALVIMAATLLTKGISILKNIPPYEDVLSMVKLLKELGVNVDFDIKNQTIKIDTSNINNLKLNSKIMQSTRTSILVLGPLLSRFGSCCISNPGGCKIGLRPINFHLQNFEKMGTIFKEENNYLIAKVEQLKPTKLVLEYPSVGATENLIMAATLTQGKTKIINAALEPEILDLIEFLKKMGARIHILFPSIIEVEGVLELKPTDYTIIYDRLEAGSLLLAAAITCGDITITNAKSDYLDVFLLKLEEMGHQIICNENCIRLIATDKPKATTFKTMPYPGFPTDLQAPMMAALALANGISQIEETVFENRFLHVQELCKMGAQIKIECNKAFITGVKQLQGTHVNATDIRCAVALVIAGLSANGCTTIKNIYHFKRGYYNFDEKLNKLGAQVKYLTK